MGIGNLFKKAGTAIIDKSGIKDSEAYRKMSSEVQKVQDAVKNPGSVMGMLKDKVAAAGANANDASRTLLRSMSGEDVDEEETADAFDSVVSDFKGRIARERNPETARAANLLLSMIEGGSDDEDDEDEEYDEEAEREAAKRKALEEAAAKRAALDAAAAGHLHADLAARQAAQHSRSRGRRADSPFFCGKAFLGRRCRPQERDASWFFLCGHRGGDGTGEARAVRLCA